MTSFYIYLSFCTRSRLCKSEKERAQQFMPKSVSGTVFQCFQFWEASCAMNLRSGQHRTINFRHKGRNNVWWQKEKNVMCILMEKMILKRCIFRYTIVISFTLVIKNSLKPLESKYERKNIDTLRFFWKKSVLEKYFEYQLRKFSHASTVMNVGDQDF